MARANETFYLVRRYTDATGAGLTGLSPTCQIGASPGRAPSVSVTVTEDSDGYYYATGSVSEGGLYTWVWSAAGGLGAQYGSVDVEPVIPTVPATIPLSNAALIDELKLKGIGAGLTDAQWSQAAKDAVRMYSRQRPRYVLGTITTQVDIEEYDLPAGGHLLLEIAPMEALTDLEELSGQAVSLSQAMASGDVIVDFHQPSQVDTYRQKLEHWSRQFGMRAEQEESGGTIRIMPRPSSVQTLAVLYTSPHDDASTVPAGDLDLLVMAGQAAAVAVLALGGAATVVSSAGRLTIGPYTRDLGGTGTMAAKLFERATELEKRFIEAASRAAAAHKA